MRWRLNIKRSLASVSLILIGIAAICCCSLAFGGRGGSYVSMAASGGFSINGEYSSVDSSSLRSMRYGSWSGSDKNTGALSSAYFRGGFGLTLAVAGYPSNKGESIRIECENGRSEQIPIASDPGERWSRLIVPLPLSWFGRRVRLVAIDDSTAFKGWIGVSELRRASLLEILNADIRVQLLLLTLLSGVVFFPCLYGAMKLCRLLRLQNLFIFPAALLIAGVIAEGHFFLTMISTLVANYVLIAIVATGTFLTALAFMSQDNYDTLRHSDTWMPFAATSACSLLYIASIALTVSPSTSPFSLLPISLPSDNFLPHKLAMHIASHLPPKPFDGDWLSSDRPPLQAGFDLIISALLPFISDVDTRYQSLCLLLQASIFGMIFCICRLCNARTLRALGVVTLSAFSGFFFINTLYVWPKLIAASYLAIAVAITIAPGRTTLLRSVAIGAAAALALLSHGGVAFTIPALLVAVAFMKRADSIRILAIATAAFIVLLAPWSWYQHVYDPPGDRLAKWHLAGQIAPSSSSFLTLLSKAYTDVPLSTIIANKQSNFHTVIGDPLPSSAERQFFFVRYALGAVTLPFIAALILFRFAHFRKSSYLAWIAAASIIFWCLVMYLPNSTVIHQGSYMTMTLLFVSGGLLATEWLPIFLVVLAITIYNFINTWLGAINFSVFFTIGGVTSFLGAMLAISLLAFIVSKIETGALTKIFRQAITVTPTR